MVSGLGLRNLGMLDRRSTQSPLQERRNSPADSFSSPDKKSEDTILSNSSSAPENKTLAKKASQHSDSETLDPKTSTKSFKLDGVKKVSNDKDKMAPTSNVNVSEFSQMQMLNIPNQYNQQMAPKVEDPAVGNTAMPLGITDIRQLPVQAQPVAKFLKSMYENFGIAPQKIISALNQLPAQVLLQSPHAAMTPLFEKLELQPKQFTKAEILFNEMISDIENVEKKNPSLMASMSMPMSTQVPLQGHTHGKLSVQQKGQGRNSQKSTLDALIEQKWNRKALEPQNYRTQNDAKEGLAPLPALSTPATPTAAQQMQAAPNNLSEIFHIDPNQIARMQAQAPVAANPVAIDKLQEYDPNIQVQDIKLNPNKITDPFFVDGQDETMTKLQQMQLKNLAQKNQNQGKDKDELKEELKNKLGEQGQILQAQDLKTDNQFSTNINNKMDANLTPNLTDVKNANVNQITQNAKALIAKGGGEMKIQLHPDGLGQVQLKVKVQDGQVGIQMTADNHEAKRLLENGMGDLKLNLAEHKLNLENMKVDVKDQMSNNLMNMEQHMQREQARDFLGQFRDWNQSLRDLNIGHGSLTAYQKAPQAPKEPTQQARRSNGDGRLYLVA